MSVQFESKPDSASSSSARFAAGGPPLGVVPRVVAWLPAVVVGLVAVVSLVRNDTAFADVAIYAAYWLLAIVLPGTLVARLLLGPRRFLPEDLAIGAVTGLAVQLVIWLLTRPLGAEVIAAWWWVPAVVACAAAPGLRVRVIAGPTELTPPGWTWSMAGISALTVLFVDEQWMRVNPLPGDGGVAHVDAWWHLAIVREFLRDAPSQIPQVAGESFSYHANAHAHVAISSVTTRLDPDVLFLRLWMVPVVITAVIAFAVLVREASGRVWAAPLGTAMAFVLLAGGFLWVGLGGPRSTPVSALSPSQIMVLPFAYGGAWLMVRMMRSAPSPGAWVAWVLFVLAGSGAKPTMVPVFLCATLLAAAMIAVRDRAVPRTALAAAAGLLVLQAWSSNGSLDERGSRITVLGSLHRTEIYRDITGEMRLRGVNDGLLLDSLTSGRAWFAMGLAIAWFVLVQAFHFAGLLNLFNRTRRRDAAAWWLGGALLSGVGVFLLLDHSASSQSYFLGMSLPLGAVLTTMLITTVVDRVDRRSAVRAAVGGVVIGALITLAVEQVAEARTDAGGFGVVERFLVPLAVVAALAIVIWVVCRRWPAETVSTRHGAAVLALAAMIGITVPTTIESTIDAIDLWSEPPEISQDQSEPGYLSAAEQEAALWLRDNSDVDDIVASNTQCRGLTTDQSRCNANGYWVSGIAGRRVVLEGWGYTQPAHAAHGIDGIHRNRTAPGWPLRYERSIAAIEIPSAEVVDALSSEYGATWLFASRRAGPVSDQIGDFATPVFDNGEVAIFRL